MELPKHIAKLLVARDKNVRGITVEDVDRIVEQIKALSPNFLWKEITISST